MDTKAPNIQTTATHISLIYNYIYIYRHSYQVMVTWRVIWSGCPFRRAYRLKTTPVNLFCISLSPLRPLNAPLSATSVSSLKSTPAENSANVDFKPLMESLKALGCNAYKKLGGGASSKQKQRSSTRPCFAIADVPSSQEPRLSRHAFNPPCSSLSPRSTIP
jgi:hypothetical protein